MTGDRVMATLLVFFSALFLTFTALVVWDATRAWQVRRRVRERARASAPAPAGAAAGSDVRKPRRLDDLPTRAFEGLPWLGDLRLLLAQARLDWSPGMFLLLSIGLATALGPFGFVLTGTAWGVPLLLSVGALLPWFIAHVRRRRRIRRFEAEFPQAMNLLARAARAGHPLSSGIGMVVDEGLPVVSEEFRQVYDEIRFGLPQSDAYLGLADRIDLMDVRIFATAVMIQREAGGNLAEVLDNIAETIRTRFSLRRQLRVYTAQGRLSGFVLALLPFVVAAALFLIDRDYIATLAEEPMGRAMVTGALALQVVGFLWIRRILDIER